MKLVDKLKFGLIQWLLGELYTVVRVDEFIALNTTVENKFLLDKKIELWYKMYKGENFAKFFNLQ
jgi:hypothetical protein